MIDTLYIEEAVADHPRVLDIRRRFSGARVVSCRRYGEVFNSTAQNFRLQKRRPALILAEKHRQLVLPVPEGYGIGARANYYFSHLLNCLYDCRYCFLQGMYRSAHYVLFVNYEDFRRDIRRIAEASPEPVHFFSGYDCDSLALEPVTGFVADFLPLFRALPNALLELRTKSTQTRALLDRTPSPNCVVAYSFTPDEIAAAVEHRTPDNARRLEALRKLQERGWPVGLRFDPLIYQEGCRDQYRRLFAQVFRDIDAERLHSVTLGVFRQPTAFFKAMERLYPDEALFAGPLETREGRVSYRAELEADLFDFCRAELLHYIPEDKLFPCRT
jgi:spore photoproduct lyase